MSRKLDLSQFRGDDSDDEAERFVPKKFALNDLKSKTFSHGITKKSKKDLEREAEEKRRIEEEKALAAVNAEVAEAFEGRGSGSIGTGMRAFGGGTGPGAGFQPRGSGFVRAGGGSELVVELKGGAGPAAPYMPPPRPTLIPTGPAAMPMPMPPMPPKGPAAMGYARAVRPIPKAPSPPPVTGPKPKGKRAMDHFLEEIKSNQQLREDRLGKAAKLEGSSVTALAAWETAPGARPAAEVETTNLFIANLPYEVTEESLGLLFAKHGPVATVKIMWPRGEEAIVAARRGKGSMTGFVSYMQRNDAEKALLELDGLDWGGSVLRLGWSKPVPRPAKALYGGGATIALPVPLAITQSLTTSTQTASFPFPFHVTFSATATQEKLPLIPLVPLKFPKTPREKWLSKVPKDKELFVKAVGGKVRDSGKGLEDVLRQKEKENPKFTFLFDEDLPEYHLYRSIVDSRYRFPTPPPDGFEDEGYASVYSSDSAEDSEKERTVKGKVGRLARKRFEAMLRGMSGKRSEIARAMQFAMTRAEAADEIAELVCLSLRLDGTPVPRKLARLHLVSDILHNSASPIPNVWKYRLAFEKRLPPVFAHLATVYQSLLAYSGRISADVFQSQVGAVLEIWERWIVFTQDVAESLRGLFDGSKVLETDEDRGIAAKQEAEAAATANEADKPMSGFKTSGFKSSFKPLSAAPVAETELDDVDGLPLDGVDVDGEPIGGEDLDGEEMGEVVDGEAIGGVDGEAMDDVDGEAIDREEDVDGEAMEMEDD